MSKTARQICIENADIPATEGLHILHNRFVEMADAIRIYKAKDMIRPTADATRHAAKKVELALNVVKFLERDKIKDEHHAEALRDLKIFLIEIAETVVHNLELTESIVIPSNIYSLVAPIFYNKEGIKNPKMKEHLQSFEFESELTASVYRSMSDARHTLMAIKFLFVVGWTYNIDLDEELIQLTKEAE